jgi:hypothetical protein
MLGAVFKFQLLAVGLLAIPVFFSVVAKLLTAGFDDCSFCTPEGLVPCYAITYISVCPSDREYFVNTLSMCYTTPYSWKWLATGAVTGLSALVMLFVTQHGIDIEYTNFLHENPRGNDQANVQTDRFQLLQATLEHVHLETRESMLQFTEDLDNFRYSFYFVLEFVSFSALWVSLFLLSRGVTIGSTYECTSTDTQTTTDIIWGILLTATPIVQFVSSVFCASSKVKLSLMISLTCCLSTLVYWLPVMLIEPDVSMPKLLAFSDSFCCGSACNITNCPNLPTDMIQGELQI